MQRTRRVKREETSVAAGTDLLAGLNERQRQAVTAGDGPLLLVAGPGSGKTRVLTHRIAYLVRERGARPWEICAVTFTNKAAREMKERLAALIGDAAREMSVSTFHALCARLLRQYGSDIGLSRNFTIYDDDDQIGIVKQALKHLDLDPKQVPPRSMLAGISAAKSSGLGPTEYGRRTETYREELVARVYRVYQETLDRNQGLDYDDLLLRALEMLNTPGGQAATKVPARYRHVLVDEYQDTNRVQFELVRALASTHGNLCVVGDPDQSIYAWRGATIQNILDFEQVYPDAQVIKLEQNYRSTQRILRSADRVITANLARKEKTLWTENGEGDPIRVQETHDERQEAQFVVQEIERLIAARNYTYRDFAVLYRTNAQSKPLEDTLLRYGIPYQLIGGTRFYERREIKDVMALLRLIDNPSDDVSLRRVIDNMPVGRGLGARTWVRLESWAAQAELSVAGALTAWATPGAAQAPPLAGKAAESARDLMTMLAELRAAIGSADLTDIYDRALELSGYQAMLREAGEQERWENIQELRASLNAYADLPRETQLPIFLEEATLVSDVDALEEGKQGVTLITLHAAKGLEYPVVFIVGLEEGLLPHARSLESESEMEEERRLAYVGITRAQRLLYVTYARQRSNYAGMAQPSTPSPFLLAFHDDNGQRRSRRPTSTATPDAASRHDPRQAYFQTLRSPARPTPAAAPKAARRNEWADLDQSVETVVAVAPGDRVRHPIFGAGTVRAVQPVRDDVEITIAFDDKGTKRLYASLARLERA